MANTTISPTIKIVQGGTKQYYVWFTDSSNNALNLTNYTGMLYAKADDKRKMDPIDISVGLTVLNAVEGAGLFTFTSTDTSVNNGDYDYQVELLNSASGYTYIYPSTKLVITKRVNQ